MLEIVAVGLDPAQTVFQVHGLKALLRTAVRKSAPVAAG